METINEEELCRLSEVVSDILTCGGYSKQRTEIFKSQCLLSEKSTLYLGGHTAIICGSTMAEGSSITGSDMDLMFVKPFIIAVNDGCELIDDELHVFVTKHTDCLPGYTRLLVKTFPVECNSF